MNKTTVYLPDEMKRDLESMAASSGRSEAQLIRDAVAALTSTAAAPRPRGQLFSGGDPTFAARVDKLLNGFGER